jgi:hypothetical protein
MKPKFLYCLHADFPNGEIDHYIGTATFTNISDRLRRHRAGTGATLTAIWKAHGGRITAHVRGQIIDEYTERFAQLRVTDHCPQCEKLQAPEGTVEYSNQLRLEPIRSTHEQQQRTTWECIQPSTGCLKDSILAHLKKYTS